MAARRSLSERCIDNRMERKNLVRDAGDSGRTLTKERYEFLTSQFHDRLVRLQPRNVEELLFLTEILAKAKRECDANPSRVMGSGGFYAEAKALTRLSIPTQERYVRISSLSVDQKDAALLHGWEGASLRSLMLLLLPNVAEERRTEAIAALASGGRAAMLDVVAHARTPEAMQERAPPFERNRGLRVGDNAPKLIAVAEASSDSAESMGPTPALTEHRDERAGSAKPEMLSHGARGAAAELSSPRGSSKNLKRNMGGTAAGGYVGVALNFVESRKGGAWEYATVRGIRPKLAIDKIRIFKASLEDALHQNSQTVRELLPIGEALVTVSIG